MFVTLKILYYVKLISFYLFRQNVKFIFEDEKRFQQVPEMENHVCVKKRKIERNKGTNTLSNLYIFYF